MFEFLQDPRWAGLDLPTKKAFLADAFNEDLKPDIDLEFIKDPRWAGLDPQAKKSMLRVAYEEDVQPRIASLEPAAQVEILKSYLNEAYQTEQAQQIKAAPERRGTLGRAVSGLARGTVETIGRAGSILELADQQPKVADTDESFLDVAGRGITDWSQRVLQEYEFLKKDKGELLGEPGLVKRGLVGGAESIPQSLPIMATAWAGAKAGAAVGGGIGGAPGAGAGAVIGGVGGAIAGLVAFFGAGTYGDEYTSAYEELKRTRPEATEEEVQEVAHRLAFRSAAFEVITEIPGTLLGLRMLGGTKVLTEPLKATLRNILSQPLPEFTKKFAAAAAGEISGEMVAGGGQAWARQAEGLSGPTISEGIKESIIPSIVMSLFFGAAAAGYNRTQSRSMMNQLNSEDIAAREAAIDTMAYRINANTQDPELALAWRAQALDFAKSGERFDFDEKVIEFAKIKTAEEYKGSELKQVDTTDYGITDAPDIDEAVDRFNQALEQPPEERELTELESRRQDVGLTLSELAELPIDQAQDLLLKGREATTELYPGLQAEYTGPKGKQRILLVEQNEDESWKARSLADGLELTAKPDRIVPVPALEPGREIEYQTKKGLMRGALIEPLGETAWRARDDKGKPFVALADKISPVAIKGEQTIRPRAPKIESLLSEIDRLTERTKFAGPSRDAAIKKQAKLAEGVVENVKPGDIVTDRDGEQLGVIDKIDDKSVALAPDNINPKGISFPVKDFIGLFVPDKTGTHGSIQTKEATYAGTVRGDAGQVLPGAIGALEKNAQREGAPEGDQGEALRQRAGEGGENLREQNRQESKRELSQELKSQIDEAAHEAAVSPLNELPEPTDPQKIAGNAKLGHIPGSLIGLPRWKVSVENPKDSIRTQAKPKDAPESWKPKWSNKMTAHYGYFVSNQAGLESPQGKDKDKVDVYIGDQPEAKTAFIVDQINPETKKFDEHKVITSVIGEEAAKDLYNSNYSKDWKGIGAITEVSLEELDAWLGSEGRKTEPIAYGKDVARETTGLQPIVWRARKSMGMSFYSTPIEGDTLVIRENPSGKNRFTVYKKSDGPVKNIGKFSTLEAAKEAGATIIPRTGILSVHDETIRSFDEHLAAGKITPETHATVKDVVSILKEHELEVPIVFDKDATHSTDGKRKIQLDLNNPKDVSFLKEYDPEHFTERRINEYRQKNSAIRIYGEYSNYRGNRPDDRGKITLYDGANPADTYEELVHALQAAGVIDPGQAPKGVSQSAHEEAHAKQIVKDLLAGKEIPNVRKRKVSGEVKDAGKKAEPPSPGTGQRSIRAKGGAREHAFTKTPAGHEVTAPAISYSRGVDNKGNVWVRQSGAESNDGRQLLVQFSTELINKNAVIDESSRYYDALYSGTRKGYQRLRDFWEIPQWMGYVSKYLPNADVYVVRDMAEARQFLDKAGYDRIVLSAIDVNKDLIKTLAGGFNGHVDIGGYTTPGTFDDLSNAKWHDTLESLATDIEVPFSEGVDYRHFEGAKVIPRLTMSQGCLHKCAFCTVPKTLMQTSNEVVDQQAEAFGVLDAQLVYLNDKTFGQAKNYTHLENVYQAMLKNNPDFKGFIIQTTGTQLLKMDAGWLKRSGIKYVELGVETYNDVILRSLKKPHNEAILDRAAQKLREANIAMIPNIIIGLPDETAETYQRTLDFIERNADVISHENIYNLALYEGSELATRLEATSASDVDENVLEKSFHKDEAIHKGFSQKVFAAGQRALEEKHFSIRADIQKEMAKIKRAAEKNKSYLNAPDGSPTLLDPNQWAIVRTSAFKNWFGDWEKGNVWGREDVSKVVGKNGEPLVVYHGTKKGGFSVIDPSKRRAPWEDATFFTDNFSMSATYSGAKQEIALPIPKTKEDLESLGWEFDQKDDYVDIYNPEGHLYDDAPDMKQAITIALEQVLPAGTEPGIYPVFLNIRDPEEVDFGGANWDGQRPLQYIVTKDGDQQYDDDLGYFDEDDANEFASKIDGEVEEAPEHYENTNSVATSAMEHGNDGAIIRNVTDMGEYDGFYDYTPSNVFAIFKPEQAKSATWNLGTFDPSNPDLRYSIRDTFYSKLTKEAESQNLPAKTQSVIPYLLKKGVKPTELEWMGVEQWVKENQKDGKIDRDAFRAFIALNQIKLEEAIKGGQKEKGYDELTEQFINEGWAPGIAEEMASDALMEGETVTKFAQWQIPGGTNYREMLFISSAKSPEYWTWIKEIERLTEKYGGPGFVVNGKITPEEKKHLVELHRDAGYGSGVVYKSLHWEEPNVLGHVRMNDHDVLTYTQEQIKDIGQRLAKLVNTKEKNLGSGAPLRGIRDGIITPLEAAQYAHAKGFTNYMEYEELPEEKILNLEEVQSDWHQEGKRKGYATSLKPLPEGYTVEPQGEDYPGLFQVRNPEGITVGAPGDSEEAAIRNFNRDVFRKDNLVPEAPFAENWHEVFMKRMLRYAVENGYTKLTWPTGEIQAERYDLSKQISRVTWKTKSPGDNTGSLFAFDLNDKEVIYKEIKKDEIQDYVGKDAASKLLSADRDSEGSQRISGLDLKVGGKGMEVFYDEKIPGFLNKYLKQWNGKVTRGTIDTKEESAKPWAVIDATDEGGQQVLDRFATETEARKALDEYDGGVDVMKIPVGKIPVWEVKITPEMRAGLQKLQPLFSIREADQKYLAAVESGDMETAQKMVDVAAIRAGYTVAAAHGTDIAKIFNRFQRRPGDIGMHFGTEGQARDRLDYLRSRTHRIPGPSPRILKVYLNLRNPLRLQDPGMWKPGNIEGELREAFPEYLDEIRRLRTPKDARLFIQSQGYDGIIYRNTGETRGAHELQIKRDEAWDNYIKSLKRDPSIQPPEYKIFQDASDAALRYREENAEDSYIVFERKQIKSSDPVTYDDKGNVIPLSRRFKASPDIRYAARKTEGPPLQVTVETIHGKYAALLLADRKKIHKEIRTGVLTDSVIKTLGLSFGVKVTNVIDGPGLWFNPETKEIEKNPAFSTALSVPPGQIQKEIASRIRGIAATLGLATRQEAVGFIHPVPLDPLSEPIGGPILNVDLGRTISYEQAEALSSEMAKALPADTTFLVPTATGVIITMPGAPYPMSYEDFTKKALQSLDKSIKNDVKGWRAFGKEPFEGGDYYESSGIHRPDEQGVPSFERAIRNSGGPRGVARAYKFLAKIDEIKERYRRPDRRPEGLAEGEVRYSVRLSPEDKSRVFQEIEANPAIGAPTDFKNKTVTLTHWSKYPSLTITDPSKHGTGNAGAELKAKRAFPALWIPKTYVGYGKYIREPGLGSYRYGIDINGNSLYDAWEDPLGLFPTADETRAMGFYTKAAQGLIHEQRIKDAGFRAYVSTPYSVAALFEPVEVYLAESGDQSLPQPVEDQAVSFSIRPPDTEAFKKWFGDSKVVDENGEPLVVYHGTVKEIVGRLDPAMAGTSGFERIKSGRDIRYGTHFSNKEWRAGVYAKEIVEGKDVVGKIYTAYLNIEKPLIFNHPKLDPSDAALRHKADIKWVASGESPYDGIIINGVAGEVDYIVFDADQIKSATGNIGTFDEATPDIRYAVRPPVVFAETTTPVVPQDYTANRAEARAKGKILGTGIRMAKDELGAEVSRLMAPISTRLKYINPALSAKLRRLDFATNQAIQQDRATVLPLLRKAKGMSPGDFLDWDYARKNSDVVKINELVNRYNMQAEYAAVRAMFDDLRDAAIDVGLDIGEIDEYWTRKVIDLKGLYEEMDREELGIFSKALAEKAASLGLQVYELDPDMRATLITNVILGGPTGPGGVSAAKERKFLKIPPRLNKYYMDSDAAVLEHISAMRTAIEKRKFFGKIPEKVAEMRRQLYVAQAKVREYQHLYRTEPDPIKKDKARVKRNEWIGEEKQLTAYIQKYALQRDYTDNIGAFIDEMIVSGDLKPSDENEVKEILQARFHERGAHGFWSLYKNFSYIDTMGSPISALTQIGDLAWAMYEGGMISGLKHAGKSLAGTSKITRADVGIERIAEEFADNTKLGAAVTWVFKHTGLEKMDAIGKEALLNATLEKQQKLARENPQELANKIQHIFGNETTDTINALQNDIITENVKMLVYSRLADFQPVGLSEMPQRYLTSGNGRIFYMLKTFTLKQFDVFRNEAIHKITSGSRSEKIEGLKNLMRLAMLFVLANATADELKDFVLGRQTDFSDRVADNILRLAGSSKFVTWTARSEGLVSAFAKQVLPPFKFVDSLSKDIYNAGDDKGLELTASVPLIGKLAYWHLGRGTTKRHELWDVRLRKYKANLTEVHEDLEKAVDKVAYRKEHSVELARYREVNKFQGRLNNYRKIINNLKSRPEQTDAIQKRIEQLETRRTESIKQFLEKKETQNEER